MELEKPKVVYVSDSHNCTLVVILETVGYDVTLVKRLPSEVNCLDYELIPLDGRVLKGNLYLKKRKETRKWS